MRWAKIVAAVPAIAMAGPGARNRTWALLFFNGFFCSSCFLVLLKLLFGLWFLGECFDKLSVGPGFLSLFDLLLGLCDIFLVGPFLLKSVWVNCFGHCGSYWLLVENHGTFLEFSMFSMFGICCLACQHLPVVGMFIWLWVKKETLRDHRF